MSTTRLVWVGTGLPQRLRDLHLAPLARGARAPEGITAVTEWAELLPRQQRVDADLVPLDRRAFGRGLLLTGFPGTGKTTCAAAAACEVRRRGKSVFFTRWPDHLDRARLLMHIDRHPDAADHDKISRTAYAVDRVNRAHLVVLDDVGAERVTDSGLGAEVLETVLRGRFDTGLPTIITSNLDSQQWAGRYSAPLRSFIQEACRVVVFTGPDIRGET